MTTEQATKRDTKTDIMNSAEFMMAEHGVTGVSLRAILSAAGANTAALHYHFGSREGLVAAMVARHGRALNLHRKDLIADFDSTERVCTPGDVVNFIVDPMISVLESEGEDGRRFMRFLARLQSDRTGTHLSEEKKHFPEIHERLERLLKQACSGVSNDELNVRLTMMIDTMLQSLSNAEFMAQEWNGDGHYEELATFATRLKTYLTGGLSADGS
jgi:AcrR family transcriptional regulator